MKPEKHIRFFYKFRYYDEFTHIDLYEDGITPSIFYDDDIEHCMIEDAEYIYYLKMINGKWLLHNYGSSPAMIFKTNGQVIFTYEGIQTKIEDLDVDDMEKTLMILRYTQTPNNFFYLYSP